MPSNNSLHTVSLRMFSVTPTLYFLDVLEGWQKQPLKRNENPLLKTFCHALRNRNYLKD